jgi:hypothetical protein
MSPATLRIPPATFAALSAEDRQQIEHVAWSLVYNYQAGDVLELLNQRLFASDHFAYQTGQLSGCAALVLHSLRFALEAPDLAWRARRAWILLALDLGGFAPRSTAPARPDRPTPGPSPAATPQLIGAPTDPVAGDVLQGRRWSTGRP